MTVGELMNIHSYDEVDGVKEMLEIWDEYDVVIVRIQADMYLFLSEDIKNECATHWRQDGKKIVIGIDWYKED